MPSISFLDSFYEEKYANTVHYLADIQDNGPEEPDLTQYTEMNCNARRLRRADRRQVRAHFRRH
jgi:hypothetical protein